jgi:hypothetical protein
MIVKAHSSPNYRPRTEYNAKSADLTVAFAEDFESTGERLTKKLAGDKYLAIHLSTDTVQAARLLYKQCRDRGVRVLNIAGNGIYTLSKAEDTDKDESVVGKGSFLVDTRGFNKNNWTPKSWSQSTLNFWVWQVLSLVHKHYPLEMAICGGQTGVDFAGGIAAEVIGINPVMTFPKGFLQRSLAGKDFTQTEANVMAEVERQVEDLKLRIQAYEKELEVKLGARLQVEDTSPSP